MECTDLNIDFSTSGGYLIETNDFRLQSEPVSVNILEASDLLYDFQNASKAEADIGGIKGVVYSDTSTS